MSTVRLRPRVLLGDAVLCRAGDRSDSLYLVERGVLHVLDGHTGALLGRQRAGDVVGEVALLTGEPRSDGTPDAALAALLPGEVNRVEPTADPAWLGTRPQTPRSLTWRCRWPC